MLNLYTFLIYFYTPSLFLVKIYGDNHYCDRTFCNNSKDHVLCKFPLEGPARHCNNYEKTIISANDKKLVLDKINSRRNKVAAGEIRSLRAAENMPILKWNEELAISAQRWADQCVPHSVPDMKDTCRDLDHISVGQNIATIYDDAPGLTPTMLVDLWYIELLNVNSSVMLNYQRSSVTGSDHYEYFTQLVWAETTHVGCGAVKFKEQIKTKERNKNRTVYRLICNFAPAGNVIGKLVYSDGVPCSRCPYNATCDSVYTALCTQFNTSSMKPDQSQDSIEQLGSMNYLPQIRSKYFTNTESSNTNLKNDSMNFTEVFSWPERDPAYDENMSFDFFTELFEYTTKSSTLSAENITVCKEVLIVDELFDLLKRKLSNDQTLRELLLSSKSSQSANTEETFTDSSIAEILSHIYTTKESMLTTKITSEYLNSTLLVDLVEAVIFRNNDKFSTSVGNDLSNQSATEVNPVKIRAELGETRSNSDFTGHYFFPEDNNEETSSDKQADNYYDMTDFSVSDVAFDIEELRRNKGTKDFLEEILDSDFITEAIPQTYININDPKSRRDPTEINIQIDKTEKPQVMRQRRNEDGVKFLSNYKSLNRVRKRRRLIGSFINYTDLLRRLAADLKWLKLNSMFHCSKYNSVQKTSSTKILLIVTSFYTLN